MLYRPRDPQDRSSEATAWLDHLLGHERARTRCVSAVTLPEPALVQHPSCPQGEKAEHTSGSDTILLHNERLVNDERNVRENPRGLVRNHFSSS